MDKLHKSKLVPNAISIFGFGMFIIIGILNFFTIKGNYFLILINILGLILNSFMFVLSLIGFLKLKRNILK